jgi:hypothetical protein
MKLLENGKKNTNNEIVFEKEDMERIIQKYDQQKKVTSKLVTGILLIIIFSAPAFLLPLFGHHTPAWYNVSLVVFNGGMALWMMTTAMKS